MEEPNACSTEAAASPHPPESTRVPRAHRLPSFPPHPPPLRSPAAARPLDSDSANGRSLQGKSSRWYLCANVKSSYYLDCCHRKWWRNVYDPSCPGRRRTCDAVAWKFWPACCAGKRADGVWDSACRRYKSSSCGSRGSSKRDECCAKKNPWRDSTCKAWTTGSCSSVAPSWRSTCCAQKWTGQDWWCDQQRYGSSCASWGPGALDACCAQTNPWSDRSCSAWLPSGNCGKVSAPYLDACCECDGRVAVGVVGGG